MICNYIIKYVVLSIIFINSFLSLNINEQYRSNINLNFNNFGQYSLASCSRNITNVPEIYLTLSDINYIYSEKFNLIEVTYYINLFDLKFNLIKPSNFSLLYNTGLLCNLYNFEINKNIYSFPHIYENKCYFCIEYIKLSDKAKFGVLFYKINELNEKVEYHEIFLFNTKLININKDISHIDNNRFNINIIYKNYKELLSKITRFKSENKLKYSFLQPPLCFLKEEVVQSEGQWHFKNIYENYFCFCKGESCLNINLFYVYNFQSCKYFFFLKIINDNKHIYPKTDFLLSDFFDENIESSDALPIFREMIKMNLKAHYITVSSNIYNRFCQDKIKCLKEFIIIYGIKRINGDILEKYLELFLKLKIVVAAEKYESIDNNIFYNIDYIIYIFLGHGVTYIKSFLYNDYLSPKRYNKILLPPSERFITLALEAGWKNEDIIKIGYPRWDNYGKVFAKSNRIENSKEKEKNIFIMFTWRKVKKGKNISELYFNNINYFINNQDINEQLRINNIKLFICYHHALKEKKNFNIIDKNNIRTISQNDISKLLKNTSLIITDFSSILFDAIVQKKPLILFIPDGLDPNLMDIYNKEYYETITKIIKGFIYLYEVFIDLNEVVNKTIYYIKNDFVVEKEKLKFYQQFNLSDKGNTKKFIKYIQNLY